MLLGVNDIGKAEHTDGKDLPHEITQDLMAAYRQMIVRAHSHDTKVIGPTIMPFADSFYDTPGKWNPTKRRDPMGPDPKGI